jgi:hypothetical protein
MSELWIDNVTGDWGFTSEPKTLYVDPNADQIRAWADSGRCVYCGQWGRPDDQCRCRYCDSCSQVWIANEFAPMRDTDHGPRPRTEDCPECVAWEAAGKPRECTALVRIKFCLECHQPTTGSIGAAGYYWPRLCQACKDLHDITARGQVKVQAAFYRLFEKVA